MKPLFLLFLVLCLSAFASFAKDSVLPQAGTIIFKGKVYEHDFLFSDNERQVFADLNGDGKDELVWVFRAALVGGGFSRVFAQIY